MIIYLYTRSTGLHKSLRWQDFFLKKGTEKAIETATLKVELIRKKGEMRRNLASRVQWTTSCVYICLLQSLKQRRAPSFFFVHMFYWPENKKERLRQILQKLQPLTTALSPIKIQNTWRPELLFLPFNSKRVTYCEAGGLWQVCHFPVTPPCPSGWTTTPNGSEEDGGRARPATWAYIAEPHVLDVRMLAMGYPTCCDIRFKRVRFSRDVFALPG